MILNCVRCGGYFDARSGEEWKTLCWRCWKEKKYAQEDANIRATSRIAKLNSETCNALKQNLRPLIQLCHPDKHNNSPISNKITQWLNELNSKL